MVRSPDVRPSNRAAAGFAPVLWALIRISGLLLLVFTIGHLAVTHYLNAPSATGAAFVARRWHSVFWLGFDWLLLILALVHGLAGIQTIVEDSVRAIGPRCAVAGTLLLLALAMAVLGTWNIATFDPVRLASGRGPLSGHYWLATGLVGILTLLATATYLAGVVAAAIALRMRMRGVPAGVWGFSSHWARLLHRISGVGIVIFLMIHVLDLLLLPLAPDLYDRTVAAYGHVYLIPMEVALVAGVLYHALNGIRITVVERGDLAMRRRQGQLWYGVLVLTFLLLMPSIAVLLRAIR